jgi:hypothetical protein
MSRWEEGGGGGRDGACQEACCSPVEAAVAPAGRSCRGGVREGWGKAVKVHLGP